MEIFNTFDICGGKPLVFHFFAIIRNIVPYILHLLDKALALLCAYLLSVGSFDLGLIILFHKLFSLTVKNKFGSEIRYE